MLAEWPRVDCRPRGTMDTTDGWFCRAGSGDEDEISVPSVECWSRELAWRRRWWGIVLVVRDDGHGDRGDTNAIFSVSKCSNVYLRKWKCSICWFSWAKESRQSREDTRSPFSHNGWDIVCIEIVSLSTPLWCNCRKKVSLRDWTYRSLHQTA